MVAVLASAPGSSKAGTSGTLHIAGQVFARATLWVSQFSLSISSFSSLNSAGSLTRKIVGFGQIWLADLGISGNGSKFTVSVQSANAQDSGQPSLVDQDTGAAIPYRLTYGGSNLTFVGGEAQLAAVPGETATAPLPLALAVPPGSDVADGRFQERIVLVVKAR